MLWRPICADVRGHRIVIELLDRLPEVGDEVTTENGIRLVVESVEKNRIGQVHIYLPSPENPEELPEN